MRLKSVQLCAGSWVPKLDNSHGVSRNNRPVTANVEYHSDGPLKCAADVPKDADRPHKRSLPPGLVRGKPVCDSARRKIPFSNTAVSTPSYKPAIQPAIIVFTIGTIVGVWADFSGGETATGNWGTPGNAEKAGPDFSEFAQVGEAVMLGR